MFICWNVACYMFLLDGYQTYIGLYDCDVNLSVIILIIWHIQYNVIMKVYNCFNALKHAIFNVICDDFNDLMWSMYSRKCSLWLIGWNLSFLIKQLLNWSQLNWTEHVLDIVIYSLFRPIICKALIHGNTKIKNHSHLQ